MTAALIAHASAHGDNGATTSGVDTSTATFLVAVAAYASIVTGFSFGDNKSNSFTALTEYSGGALGRVRVYYCANATVGSGHTVTLGGTNLFGSVCFAAFSGVKLSSPFDAENGAGSLAVSTQQAGSVSPAEGGELLIAGLAFSPAGTITTDESYTVVEQQDAGDDIGSALAWAIKNESTNPTFTKGGTAGQMIATLAAFKCIAPGANANFLLAM